MIEYADCQEEMTREERLAAAAPELLAVLRELVEGIEARDKRTGFYTMGVDKARAAIDRAEGVR